LSIAFQLDGAEYDPAQFPGLIYRMKDPKTAILLFHSGKLVCTGGKSSSQVERSIQAISAQLRKGKVPVVRNPKIEIQNIVATSDLGSELDLNIVAVTLGLDRVEYEPEQFPGLVYRIDDPRVVLLLFSSGKMVCTGARRPRDLALAVEKIGHELQSAGLLSLNQIPERPVGPKALPRRRTTPVVPDVPPSPGDLEAVVPPMRLDAAT